MRKLNSFQLPSPNGIAVTNNSTLKNPWKFPKLVLHCASCISQCNHCTCIRSAQAAIARTKRNEHHGVRGEPSKSLLARSFSLSLSLSRGQYRRERADDNVTTITIRNITIHIHSPHIATTTTVARRSVHTNGGTKCVQRGEGGMPSG